VISEAHFSDILLRIKPPFINTKGCRRFPIITFYSYLHAPHKNDKTLYDTGQQSTNE